MSKILISGGCGFVGSWLAVHLANQGHEVLCMDNLLRRGSELLRKRIEEAGARFIHGDARNSEDLERAANNIDVLLDCCAEPSVLVGSDSSDAWFVIQNNLVSSLNCFEYARRLDAGVIFFSTSRVYPYNLLNSLPLQKTDTRYKLDASGPGYGPGGINAELCMNGARSLYGATKYAAETILTDYAIQYDIPSIINRCGVLAGPWQLGKIDQGVFTYWIASHIYNRPLRYEGFGGDGCQVRDLLHVKDLAALIDLQLEGLRNFRGSVFPVGGGRNVSLSLTETTTLCRRITGTEFDIGSILETRPADIPWYVTDNSHVERTFNWKPRYNPESILYDIYCWIKTRQEMLRPILTR